MRPTEGASIDVGLRKHPPGRETGRLADFSSESPTFVSEVAGRRAFGGLNRAVEGPKHREHRWARAEE